MSELIHYKFAGDKSKPCLLIVHGLFGSLDNWQSLAKKWSENFYVISIDVRNHGRSFHSDDMRFSSCAMDIKSVLKNESIEKCHLLGHSMGGKIAMEFASLFPDSLISLIIVDVAPYKYPPHHADIFVMIKGTNLAAYTNRNDIENAIRSYIHEEGVVQFMMKNIRRNEQSMKFEWKFNWQVLYRDYLEIIQYMPQKGFAGKTIFIGGEQSKYITKETSLHIFDLYPKAELEFISNAGHWVHADNPDEFYHKVNQFIDNK